MGFFSNLFGTSKNSVDPKKEIESIQRGQAMLDERFKKKQVPNEYYVKQSQENNARIEKLRSQIKEED